MKILAILFVLTASLVSKELTPMQIQSWIVKYQDSLAFDYVQKYEGRLFKSKSIFEKGTTDCSLKVINRVYSIHEHKFQSDVKTIYDINFKEDVKEIDTGYSDSFRIEGNFKYKEKEYNERGEPLYEDEFTSKSDDYGVFIFIRYEKLLKKYEKAFTKYLEVCSDANYDLF